MQIFVELNVIDSSRKPEKKEIWLIVILYWIDWEENWLFKSNKLANFCPIEQDMKSWKLNAWHFPLSTSLNRLLNELFPVIFL